MTYNPRKHRRRSIRLKGYDYTQPGAYFVTICTHRREMLFGRVVDGVMQLNEFGRIVEWTWYDLPNHVANITLDAFVIMPNHVHGIIIINPPATVGAGSPMVGAGSEPAPTIDAAAGPKPHGLPEIVRQFKTFSARRINARRGVRGVPVWQRNYYEHIIRNQRALNAIRRYIIENPARWQKDRENPHRKPRNRP